MQIEKLIISNLLLDDNYFRKAIPFLKSEYFSGEYKTLLRKIQEYSEKYNKPPTKQALAIAIEEDKIVSPKQNFRHLASG